MYHLGIVVVGALVQRLTLLAVVGVKPNLALALLVALAPASSDWLWQGALAAASYLVLAGGTPFTWSVAVTHLIGLGAFWCVRFLPWQPLVNVAVTTAGGTILIYGLTAFSFLSSHPSLLAGEVVYNLLVSIVVYEATHSRRSITY